MSRGKGWEDNEESRLEEWKMEERERGKEKKRGQRRERRRTEEEGKKKKKIEAVNNGTTHQKRLRRFPLPSSFTSAFRQLPHYEPPRASK